MMVVFLSLLICFLVVAIFAKPTSRPEMLAVFRLGWVVDDHEDTGVDVVDTELSSLRCDAGGGVIAGLEGEDELEGVYKRESCSNFRYGHSSKQLKRTLGS
jgi:hypothetical protein